VNAKAGSGESVKIYTFLSNLAVIQRLDLYSKITGLLLALRSANERSRIDRIGSMMWKSALPVSDSSGLGPYVMNLGDYTVSTPNNLALRVWQIPKGKRLLLLAATKV
jgi:hypothetical protein